VVPAQRLLYRQRIVPLKLLIFIRRLHWCREQLGSTPECSS
jgi:hypothetical protein